MSEERPRWSNETKLIVQILLLALFLYLLVRFSVLLTPLVLAVILAYILAPVANFFQHRLRLPRGGATLLSFLLVLLGTAAIISGIIPLLVAQFSGLNLDIQRFLRGINNLFGNRIYIAGQVIDLGNVLEQIEVSLRNMLEPLFGQTLGFAVDVLTSLAWVIFIFVVAFYLIKDSEELRIWSEELIPSSYREDFISLRADITHIWSSFFRGQILLVLIVTVLFSIIGPILGLPFSLALAVFAGLMEFLPSVGHNIWLVVASLLAFFVGSTWIPLPNWAFTLVVIGVHFVYQQFDLNYLIPRIIGRRVQLPPLVVILGIVTGAILAGVLGILLAAPTIASARVLGRYIYTNLFEEPESSPSDIVTSLPPPNPRWWHSIIPRRKSKKSPGEDGQ